MKNGIRAMLDKDKEKERGGGTSPVTYLEEHGYLLNNPIIRQYAAFSGMLLMGPKMVAMNGESPDIKIYQTSRWKKNHRCDTDPFTSDLLIPTLITARYKKGWDSKEKLKVI